MPKVSICIPTYRQVKYLKDTLDSVLLQTFKDYEVIVTDDTEGDSVEKVVTTFDFKGRLKYFKNPLRLGAPANWNKAIELSSGEYIKILHHDDKFTYEHSLSAFVDALDNSPETDFVFSAAIGLNAIKGITWHHASSAKQLAELTRNPYSLFWGNFIGPPSSVMFRNNVKTKFDVNIKWVVDICFYIECLLKNSNYKYINEELITSVIDAHNVSNEYSSNSSAEVREFIYMFKKTTHGSLMAKMRLLKFFSSLFSKYNIHISGLLKDIMQGEKIPLLLQFVLWLKRRKAISRLYHLPAKIKSAMGSTLDLSTPDGIIKEWKRNGKPLPPPAVFKRRIIEKYARESKTKVFIETGTLLGETIEYCKPFFKELISIELGEDLYNKAKKKFENDQNVHMYQGDSGDVIKKVLENINEPCLFWLDGHYSEGITAKGALNTPILAELEHIFNHKINGHIVLIDDARCFTGKDDYPTIGALKDIVKARKPKLSFEIADDIIRIK